MNIGRVRHTAIKWAARTFWNMPGRFGLARVLGPGYSLRCVVFHDVSESESPFTKGLGVTITPAQFEGALRFLTRYYNPVSLQEVLAGSRARRLPARPILVTFDDGYASTMNAAVLCHRRGVPATFFLNAAFIDNNRLAPDNLICYAMNVFGLDAMNQAIRAAKGSGFRTVRSLPEIFSSFLPGLSLTERETFLDALIGSTGVDGRQLAAQAALYCTRNQVSTLSSLGFEIGNHTYSHVHCRLLTARDLDREIDRNKTELETQSGMQVRAFSLPYGSSVDLTEDVAAHLQRSGHEAVFFSESVANPPGADTFRLDRIGSRAASDDLIFFEIEVLPRLRAMRNRLRSVSGN